MVLLTRDRGKKRGVAQGGARSRKRFGGALEPFTHVRVAYQEREQRDLVRLDYADVLGSPLTAGGEACTYASYFAELLDEWAPENDPQERLFRLGVAVLDAMQAGVGAERLARYFEYWLLRLQGVYPSIHACPQCGGAVAGRGGARAPCRTGSSVASARRTGRAWRCRQARCNSWSRRRRWRRPRSAT